MLFACIITVGILCSSPAICLAYKETEDNGNQAKTQQTWINNRLGDTRNDSKFQNEATITNAHNISLGNNGTLSRMESQSPKTILTIMALFPMTGTTWPAGNSIRIVSQMALDDINARTDILRDYQLSMHISDTKCEKGVGIDAFYEQIYKKPVKVSVLGPGCSVACVPTSLVTQLWNLTQVSMNCMTATLSDRTAHSNIYRTVQSTLTTNPGYVALCCHFRWSKVAILSRSRPAFSSTVDDLVKLLHKNEIDIITNFLFQTDFDFIPQIKKLQEMDARIIITYFYENTGIKVFCEVYRMRLFGPKIIWIIPNWYSPDWFNNAERDGPPGCLPEHLILVTNYSIAIGSTYKSPIAGKGLAGMTPDEFDTRYANITNNIIPFGSKYTHVYYDSVWCIALALNLTANKLIQRGSNLTLADVSYENRYFYNLMIESFEEIDFLGLMGNSRFNSHGETHGMINIEQRLGKTTTLNAVYYVESGEEEPTLKWIRDIRFQNGKSVRDSAFIIHKDRFLSKVVYGCLSMFSSLGILMAMVFLTFNIWFRKMRIIKLSSPTINNFILAGCILSYLLIFFQDISPPNKLHYCTIRLFLDNIGFVLTLSPLLAKTWRVHKILTEAKKTSQKIIIRDIHLITAVVLLSMYDMVLICIRVGLAPFYLHTDNIKIQPSAVDGDILYQIRVTNCKSVAITHYFDIALAVWHALMLIFGAFLAWETRTISVPSLNDSKLIGICIYRISVFSIIEFAINYVLGRNSIEAHGFAAAFTLASTTLTQLIVFLPKAIVVMKGGDNNIGPITEFAKETITERNLHMKTKQNNH